MSQGELNINPNRNPNAVNVNDPQQEPNVQNGQPRADLPPEMQNAQPAKRSILGRIAAFFFGAGVGGAFGATCTFATATAFVASGIITGGAAIGGGLLALGLYIGIKALISHFRQAPAPEPRLQNLPENNLPGAEPRADAFNNGVVNAVTGDGILSESLSQAAGRAVSQLRDTYGEALVPQDAQWKQLLGGNANRLANDIRALESEVTPEKMEELLVKHLRDNIARNAVENAFKPLCGQDANLPRILCNHALEKHPQLVADLKNATTPEQVQQILSGHAEEFNEMVALYQSAKQHEGTKAKVLSRIAQSAGLDSEVVASFMKPGIFQDKIRKLTSDVVQGKVSANEVDQAFSKLVDDLAKPYVDALAAVDADKTLSAATKATMRMEILSSDDTPRPELYSKGIAAGKTIDVTALKTALDQQKPAEEVHRVLFDLGEEVNKALKAQYGEAEWNTILNGKPDALRKTQGAAFLAMLDKEPGLMEALRARQDLDVFSVMNNLQDDDSAPLARRAGAIATYAGYVRLLDVPLNNDEFVKMEKRTQSLNAIKNAGENIPQEFKTRWTGMVMSGAISEPAMLQSLIENVGNPNLSAETRPIMEHYILMQSYAPGDAEASAQKAHDFANEIAGWRNFNTAEDQTMAPVDNWIKDDLTNTLYEGQNYTRSISDQMTLDAPRGVFIINGAIMNKPSGDEVAHSLRRVMPTEEATKMISSIINQRSFGPLNALGMQVLTNGEALPPDVLAGMTKMASRDLQKTGSLLHLDLSMGGQADVNYTVTVQNGRAYIEMSQTVGLDSGFGTDENGKARLAGKARYTLHFECDLLGNDGHSPSIESVHLQQQLMPVE